jgi:hypothetical protein
MGLSLVSMYQANKAANAQDEAQKLARADAATTAATADQAFNKANQKKPNTASLYADNAKAGKNGASGTMLTGSQGVDPSALMLGKSTLLGG